jgi:mannosyl-3-phosphoglycerate phosphatase
MLSRQLGLPLRGFGDMEASEIARRTGLSEAEVALARRREYDEPFVPERSPTDEEATRLEEGAAALGLRVTRGGRFHHLVGPGSKGAAAKALLSGYATAGAPVRSLGLGDGPTDLELLQVTDRAAVVARPDGTHAPELRAALPEARFTPGIGPEGFNQAVLEYLARPW